jgi:hypothetical protein
MAASHHSSSCLTLDSLNSTHNLQHAYNGEFFNSDGTFLFLKNIEADFPNVCLDAVKHLSCLLTSPPCDEETGMPLKICKETCAAYNILMSGPTCDAFYDFFGRSQLTAFHTLRTVYVNFDCNNISTYFFNDLTVFDSRRCTGLFSLENQGLEMQ